MKAPLTEKKSGCISTLFCNFTNPTLIKMAKTLFCPLILHSHRTICSWMKRANADNNKVNKSADVPATFWYRHMLA